MTITVLHMRPLPQLTEIALLARLRAGETGGQMIEMALREQARRPSLDLSLEALEALAHDAAGRARYFRDLRLAQVKAARALYLLDGYAPVAQVDGDLTDAFTLTNSHDEAWTDTQSAKLRPLVDRPCASSQIGDVFQDDATGEVFVCASDGFESLGLLGTPSHRPLRQAA